MLFGGVHDIIGVDGEKRPNIPRTRPDDARRSGPEGIAHGPPARIGHDGAGGTDGRALTSRRAVPPTGEKRGPEGRTRTAE